MTTVSVHSYTHSVTYVADNIHKSFKDIIRMSGLDPAKLMETRESTLKAMQTWIQSQDLTKVVLEIFDPVTDKLVIRWDINISYEWSADDGSFYTDTEQLKYHIKKAGVTPAYANYRLLLMTKPGRPDVDGWSSTTSRSTDGMVKQSLGSTVQHSGLGANAGYWRTT